MTWAEFILRLHGHRRAEERQMLHIRELGWIIYNAPHQDPKKMKRSIDAFWPLNNKSKKKVTDEMRKRMEEVTKAYLEKKKEKEGNG